MLQHSEHPVLAVLQSMALAEFLSFCERRTQPTRQILVNTSVLGSEGRGFDEGRAFSSSVMRNLTP